MLVYVVRHGQSESNLGRYYPDRHVHLTDKGVEDARRAGTVLSGVHFTHIYSSDFDRAMETAQAAMPGCSPAIDPRLGECDYGSLVGMNLPEVKRRYGESFLDNQRRRDYRPYGGESTEQQVARVGSFVKDLEALDPDSVVCVFCHEGSVKSFLCVVLDQLLNFRKIACDNGSIAIFGYNDGKWTLRKWNVTAD